MTANASGAGTFAGSLAGAISVVDKTTEASIAAAAVTALGTMGASTVNTGGFTNPVSTADEQVIQPPLTFTTARAHPDTDLIDAPGHGFLGGEAVLYAPGGLPIDGLTPGALYYILYVNASTIALSRTRGGTRLDLLPPTSLGAQPGDGHALIALQRHRPALARIRRRGR